MKKDMYQYANKAIRYALLKEIDDLTKLLPDTENTQRNLRRIQEQSPIQKMSREQMCVFVNLLARSVSDEEYEQRISIFAEREIA